MEKYTNKTQCCMFLQTKNHQLCQLVDRWHAECAKGNQTPHTYPERMVPATTNSLR